MFGSTDAPNVAVDGKLMSERMGGGSVVTGSRGAIREPPAHLRRVLHVSTSTLS